MECKENERLKLCQASHTVQVVRLEERQDVNTTLVVPEEEGEWKGTDPLSTFVVRITKVQLQPWFLSFTLVSFGV